MLSSSWRVSYRKLTWKLRPTHLCIHRASISYLHPSIQSYSKALSEKQPMFSVHPDSIRILFKPAQFYDLLLSMIRHAKRRIFISSLYIGSTESELIRELREALQKNSSLHLHLQLDLNRSTRPGPSSTAKILIPLLEEFPSRVHIFMFRSPSLRGLLAKLVPPRFNEGWGTWHAKIYGVDDNVVISGANLNKSYFTNRQDRYIQFSGHQYLAQYCFDFLQTVSSFSYQLLPSTSLSPVSNALYSYNHEGYTLYWPDSRTHPHYFHQKAKSLLSEFQTRHITINQAGFGVSSSTSLPESRCDNIILFPVIQAGQFDIREEEIAFQLLFQHLTDRTNTRWQSQTLLDLTSGYFSLYKPYQDFILNSSNVDCRIIAASPSANGFYGSKGISGRIPEGYTLFEQQFMNAVKRAGRSWTGTPEGGSGVQLSEWVKDSWTYHAKGIWLSPNRSDPPFLTLFGSTNLNSRSSHLDTELSFFMIAPSEAIHSDSSVKASPHAFPSGSLPVRQALAQELGGIRSNTVEWKGEQRNVRCTTKILAGLVNGML